MPEVCFWANLEPKSLSKMIILFERSNSFFSAVEDTLSQRKAIRLIGHSRPICSISFRCSALYTFVFNVF